MKGKINMSNITKQQFKKMIQNLNEELSNIRLKFEDLQSDLENESSEIEPYDGKENLTTAQEERQQWLDETATIIDDLVSTLSQAEDDLENQL